MIVLKIVKGKGIVHLAHECQVALRVHTCRRMGSDLKIELLILSLKPQIFKRYAALPLDLSCYPGQGVPSMSACRMPFSKSRGLHQSEYSGSRFTTRPRPGDFLEPPGEDPHARWCEGSGEKIPRLPDYQPRPCHFLLIHRNITNQRGMEIRSISPMANMSPRASSRPGRDTFMPKNPETKISGNAQVDRW